MIFYWIIAAEIWYIPLLIIFPCFSTQNTRETFGREKHKSWFACRLQIRAQHALLFWKFLCRLFYFASFLNRADISSWFHFSFLLCWTNFQFFILLEVVILRQFSLLYICSKIKNSWNANLILIIIPCIVIFRDAEDHIAWLLQHGFHEKALAAVEAGQGRNELLDEVSYAGCLCSLLW